MMFLFQTIDFQVQPPLVFHWDIFVTWKFWKFWIHHLPPVPVSKHRPFYQAMVQSMEGCLRGWEGMVTLVDRCAGGGMYHRNPTTVPTFSM